MSQKNLIHSTIGHTFTYLNIIQHVRYSDPHGPFQILNYPFQICREDIEVMAKLDKIGRFALKKTGIFHNQATYYNNKMKKTSKIAEGLDKQVQQSLNIRALSNETD